MRTLIIILLGFAFWGLSLGIAKYLTSWSDAVKSITTYTFIILWLIATAYNISIGISKGYTFTQELPVLLITFLLPAITALIIRFKVL